ncbi:light-dependent protochlorophyllide oxido-reductase [Chrysochromulina tobinii]|jgi:protochlorophyllide reductase|uniref:Light-dependent protochlorophyllide oxido-reductase n=1 Tax=Chrysochromulina tobinii TaxID=1460289 RepID=A0A0M0K0V9_9EUKA|nr:light-dependent protochlorophyllide oxido-reductase [Chrysochromulina tobinii]|eukprot:KOO32506.1 light-dependent protochlorophyllide oxido-reductase [Chrysochromulina sp. CCMP291]
MVDGGAYDPDKAYKDSKLCNMLFMAEASRRFAPLGVTVNAFSPGLIADPKGFFRNQNQLFGTVFNAITQVVGVAETNEFGGSALAYMAVDPSLDDVTGGWYDTLPPGKHQLAVHKPSAEAQDVGKQKVLWEASAALVGLPSTPPMLAVPPTP